MDYRQDPLYKKFQQEKNQQQQQDYRQDPLYSKFKQQQQNSQNRMDAIDEYIPDFAEDFVHGAAKNITDYTASAAKLLGSDKWQKKARLASNTLNKNIENEYVGMAGEMLGDPLNLAPAGIFTKGTKLARIGKSMAGGAVVGGATMGAKNYGNDDMTSSQKWEETGIGAGFVAGLNGLIAGLTKGRVTNAIKPEMLQGAKSDEEIANAILNNADSLGLSQQETQAVHTEVLQGKYPKVPNEFKVEKAGFGKKYEPNFQMRPNHPPATMDINTALAVLAKEADRKRVAQGLEPIYQHKNVLHNDKQSAEIGRGISDETMLLEKGDHWYKKGDIKGYGISKLIEKHINKQKDLTPEDIINSPKAMEQSESYINKGNLVFDFPNKKDTTFRIVFTKKTDKNGNIILDNNNKEIWTNASMFRRGKGGRSESLHNQLSKEMGSLSSEFSALQSSSNETIIPQTNKNIKANGMHSMAGGFAGGADSLINQRDYNGDGKYDYKDLLAGVAAGTISINALKKLAPKLFEEEATGGFKAGLFVGSKGTEKGAFSDIATKKTMKEIDDSKSKVSNGTWGTSEDIKVGNSTTAKLDEILDHKELFEKYPELKNTIVHLKPDMQGASFDADANRIIVGYDTKTKNINKSSLLHEIQHSIQAKEGFARGGSPDNMHPKDMYETIIERYGNLPAIEKIENDYLDSKIATENEMYEKVINMASNNYGGIEKLKYDTYKRLHGEQQARATQYRMDMSLEQRQSEDWTKTLEREEGSYKEPIIKFENGNTMSMSESEDILKSYTDEALKNPTSNRKINLGIITDVEAKKILDSTGIDLKGYNRYIDGNHIRHTIKGHGNIEKEAQRGQIALTSDDISKIPQIITSFDSVEKSVRNGKKNLLFKKKFPDGTIHYIEAVGENKKVLFLKTMYKKMPPRTDALPKQSPALTPKTIGGLGKIIPQTNKNIKANGMHSMAGGFAGGADSLINQRDYNGDGKYDYKDLLAGVAAGTISINALKKLAPKLFEEEATGGFKAGLFAGNKAKGFDAAKSKGKTFDGKYDTLERFEIDDSKAKLKSLAKYVNTQEGTKLENILDHKELFDNYPDLKNIDVKFHKGSGSSFSKDGIEIGVKDFKTKDDFKSTLLHEIQHSIQKKEGFARGGSAQEFYNDFKSKIDLLKYELEFEPDDFIRDKKLRQLSDLESKYKYGGKEEAFKMYQNLAGEIEARDVQARADYTPWQREKIEPYSSEDIAPEDAVMRFNNSDDALIDGLTQNHARELEDKYLNKSSDRVLENEIMKDASELPKPVNNYQDFKKQFKWSYESDNYFIDTPVGSVFANPKTTWKHFSNNTYFQDRSNINGAFFETLNDPLFVVKKPYKGDFNTVFYKPFKDKNSKYHLASFAVNKNGELINKTFFEIDNIGKVKELIKVPDGNMLYFKNTKKVDTPITNDGGMTSNSKGVEPLSDKHSSHTKSATNKGETSALNEWENRSADEIIPQEKQMSQTKEEFLGKFKEAKKKGYAHLSKIVSDEAQKEWGDAASTLKRWFTDTLGAKYHDIRESATASTNGMSVKLERLHGALKELNEADRTALHNYVSGDSKDIPQTLKPLADNIKKSIDDLSKELVDRGVLTKEQYDEWAGHYIHRNYEQHFFKDVKNLMKKGFKIDDIHKRGKIEEISEKDAKKLLVDPKFIASTQKPLRDGGQRLTKLANGKYELRRDWTKAEREAMNEITDGAVTIPETLMRLKRMADNAKFLDDVSKIDEVILKDAENFTDDEIKAAGFIKAPNSPKFGVLAGKHIRRDVFDDISARNDEIFNTLNGSDGAFARVWKNYLSLWKKSKTVWNAPSHLNNFMSNQFLMHLAGMRTDEIVTAVGRAGKMMYKGNKLEKLMQKKMLGKATKEELKELEDMGEDLKYFLEAKEGGLLGRSQLNDILAGQQNIEKKGVLGKLDKFTEDMYHGEDAINKIAMYAHLREKVGMSADEARKAVLTIMPDYSKPMPKGYRVLRDTGVSPFISWSYYTMPAIWKLLKTKQGAKKAALAMGTLAGLEYALTGGAVTPIDNMPFYNGSKPEDFKGRRFGIGRSGDTIHTLKTDRWIPYIELTDPVNFLVSNVSGVTTNAVVNTLTAPSKAGMINPYYGRPITYKNKSAGQKTYDYAKYLTQSYVPLPSQLYTGWNIIESLSRSKKNRRRNKVVEPRTTTQQLLKNIGLNSLSYSRSQAIKENND